MRTKKLYRSTQPLVIKTFENIIQTYQPVIVVFQFYPGMVICDLSRENVH